MTLANPPTTEAVLCLAENPLGILLAGGLDPLDAAWACDIFVLLVTGVSCEDDVRHVRGRNDDDDDHREQVDELYRTFAGLPPDQFPLIAAHAAQMVAVDGETEPLVAIDVAPIETVSRRPGDAVARHAPLFGLATASPARHPRDGRGGR